MRDRLRLRPCHDARRSWYARDLLPLLSGDFAMHDSEFETAMAAFARTVAAIDSCKLPEVRHVPARSIRGLLSFSARSPGYSGHDIGRAVESTPGAPVAGVRNI